jgi:hypothetical protein
MMSEDLDPVETALWWLRRIVKNQGVLSVHDFNHVVTTVVPEAEKCHKQLQELISTNGVIL